VSALRAKCPDCRTLTAVAIGPDYQCHACGREFAAGLIRVPRAWGGADTSLAAGAHMDIPWPEAATVEEESLEAQIETMRRELPARPLVLGGCSFAHVGAVRELVRRHTHVAVVWLGTPGPWLRMLIDARDLADSDILLLGTAPRLLPDSVYVAIDGEPADLDELEQLLGSLPRPVGAGFTGFTPSERNEVALGRLGHALGL
jgi:hypothetical protein